MATQRFKLRDVDGNPFRDLASFPVDAEKVAELKESFESTTFWENLVGRIVGKRLQIAYGHNRLAALKEMYDGTKEFDFIIREFTDAQMIQAMARENNEVYATTVQALLESIRVTVRAFSEGKISDEEMPPPPKAAKLLRYAPSFKIGFPGVGKQSRAYTGESLAKFLGHLKESGHAKERFLLCLDALDLHESGEFPTHKLNRCENIYGEGGLRDEVEERMEQRKLNKQEDERNSEEFSQQMADEQEKKYKKDFEERIKDAKQGIKRSGKALKAAIKAEKKAARENEKAQAKAEKTKKPADSKAADKKYEAHVKAKADLEKARDDVKGCAAILEDAISDRDKYKRDQESAREKAAEQERDREERAKERQERRDREEAEEEETEARIHKLKLEIVAVGYKTLAAKTHPDKAGGQNDRMIELNLAKEQLDFVLSDGKKLSLVQ